MTPEELYMQNLRLVKDLRCFKAGFSIGFDVPLTILVGENGSGKSTLLDLIRTVYRPDDDLDDDLKDGAEVIGRRSGCEQVRYFDFHRMNLKFGAAHDKDVGAQLMAQLSSSGEAITNQLVSEGIINAQNSLLLIDETGRGLSLNRQRQFALGIYQSCVMYNNQAILATHSEYIMMLSKLDECKLYSVEHQQYMTLEEFKKAHFQPLQKRKC